MARPKPPIARVSLALRIPPVLLARVKAVAAERQIPLNAAGVALLEAALQETPW